MKIPFIDTFLDKITMYRLVLYELIALVGLAIFFSFFGLVPYSWWALVLSVAILVSVSYVSNKVFAFVFKAPANVESVYITALILALIVAPLSTLHNFPLLFWAAVLAQGSKYIFALFNKHLFNPVALAVVLTSFVLDAPANWWVGTTAMAIPVFIFGLTIVRKIQREDMVFTFFLIAVVIQGVFTLARGGDMFVLAQTLLFHSSLLFFGFVMFTEPLTTPPTKRLQVVYACLVAILFTPQFSIGSIYSTPELALVVGNVFSYLVSPKRKLLLTVQEKLMHGKDMIDFVFSHPNGFSFVPGQYMEWTLPHPRTDSRGNRRYFTIASSPTEEHLHLGVKFYPQGSSFKKALLAIEKEKTVFAGQLAGDFTLPHDQQQKLVFLAGGIGITPFRSMIKYCVDMKQNRTITLFYSNTEAAEIMYKDIFDEAQTVGIQTIYTLTDVTRVPQGWSGGVGRIDAVMIQKHIPDFKERMFYLSGPHMMVESYETLLKSMGVAHTNIKKDFFPGYA